MNITLRDLLRWPESPLYTTAYAAAPPAEREAALLHPDRTLSWPVTMRATPPMLSHVEAGAIVLLSAMTLAEVRPILPGALHELRRRGVAALVLDPGEALDMAVGDLDLLRARSGVTPELELTLTRLINERRSRLYRRGTEVDRALTEATLRGRSLPELLRIGAIQINRPLLLLDEHGQIQESSIPPGALAPPRPPAPPLGVDAAMVPIPDPLNSVEWLLAPVDGDVIRWLALCGPRGGLDEMDRVLSMRIAMACALAQAQSRRSRPRLAPARRAAMIAELLRPTLGPEARANHVDLLGLEPAITYAVLGLAPRQATPEGERALVAARRVVAARTIPHVTADEFTDEQTGMTGFLLHSANDDTLPRVATALRAGLGQGGKTAPICAALSAPFEQVAELPDAARQVRFALAILRAEGVPKAFVDWGTVDDLGAYGLLYPLWGTPAATRFVSGILGDLPEHDARYGGELLPTLLTYLRQGGAAGAAADTLKIHRNTLTYRLRRIEEVCKRSPLDPDQHLSLHLAALLYSLNGAI